MACENGCNGEIPKFNLLDWDRVKYILEQISGKIFTVWGSLNLKATAPLKLEKKADGTVTTLVGYIDEAYKDEEGNYQSGIMSAADKKKLDGISVSGVTEGNGLSVDAEGNISMGLATETESGAMSSGDKAFLDSLSGALGSLMVVATDANNNIIGVNGVDLMFVGTETSKTFYLTAYKDGKKVDISQCSFPIAPFSKGSLDDGVLTVYARRTYALTTVNVSSPLTIMTDDSATRIYLTAKSDSQCYDILKGQVYVASNKMTGTLWTFDGDKPKLRFVGDGTYWVELPQSWADVLGEFDETRLFVQVTMAGKNVAAHVYCGRYDAGEEYNGNTASTDCWGAVLILTSDVENESVDGSFYINVAYLPSVETYVVGKEIDLTYELEATLQYNGGNRIPYEGGEYSGELTAYLITKLDDEEIGREEVTPDSTFYTLEPSEWADLEDDGTGLIKWDGNSNDEGRNAVIGTKVYYTAPNGTELAADVGILVYQNASGITYDLEATLQYNGGKNIPAEGGEYSGEVTAYLITKVYGDETEREEVTPGSTFYTLESSEWADLEDEGTGLILWNRNTNSKSRNDVVSVDVYYTAPDGTELKAQTGGTIFQDGKESA